MPRGVAFQAPVAVQPEPAPTKPSKAGKQPQQDGLNYAPVYPYPLSYHAYPGANIQYQTPISTLLFPPQQVYGTSAPTQASTPAAIAAPLIGTSKKDMGGVTFDAVEFTLDDARKFLRDTFKLSIEFNEPLGNLISCSQSSFVKAIRYAFEKKRASALNHKKNQVSFTVSPVPIPVFRRLFKENDVGTSSTRTQSNHTRETLTIVDPAKLDHVFGKDWDDYAVYDIMRDEGKEPKKDLKGHYRILIDEKKSAAIKITYEPATETLRFNAKYFWSPHPPGVGEW